MANKVKPFYIRITDDMTPQMVQDAFDKCHNLGVRASNNDDIENLFDWFYFGVCAKDGTYLSESEHGYFDAQEITLDQFDEWLGLKSKVEWDGQGLPPVGVDCEMKCKNSSSQYWRTAKVFAYDGSIAAIWHFDNEWKHATIDTQSYQFRKPETPEQKAERKKKEAIDEITDFLNSLSPHCKEKMEYVARAIVDKTNYRKQ